MPRKVAAPFKGKATPHKRPKGKIRSALRELVKLARVFLLNPSMESLVNCGESTCGVVLCDECHFRVDNQCAFRDAWKRERLTQEEISQAYLLVAEAITRLEEESALHSSQ